MQDWAEKLELGDELAWDPIRIVPPDPWVGHLPFAFWLIKALRPATFVELGTHSGNSYFAFCQAMSLLAPTGRAFAVDTWQGDEHAGKYGEEVFADVAAFNNVHFRRFSTLLRTTFDDARLCFAAGEIDLLHIDGMHSYDAVKHDFETWTSALSSRAVVLFHDTNVRQPTFGVWRLWGELRERFPSFEFSHSNGLGVLGFGERQPAQLRALFALDNASDAAASFRARIASRGEAFQRQVEVLDLRGRLHNAVSSPAELQWRDALLEARLEIIRSKDAMIASRDALLEARVGIIRSKDAMIASLSHTAAARAAALETRDAIIRSRDEVTAKLAADLRELRRVHDEWRQHAAAERAAMQERATAQARRASDEAQAAQAAFHVALEEQRAALTRRYTTSMSWRLTRPLRVAAGLLSGRSPTPPAAPPPTALAPSPARAEPPPALPPAPPEVRPPHDRPKAAWRQLLQVRLETFLAGKDMLRVPRAAAPDVSIVLVLYNQAELTFGCLASINETLAGGDIGIEVVIVDNWSTDRTDELLRRIEGGTILRNQANLHFLKAVNQAVKIATGRTILLLNNDAQLLPGAVASALRTLDSAPDIGAVGGRIILPDGVLQEAGSIIWRDGACTGYGRGEDPNTPDYMFQRDVDYCSAAFLLTPASVFRELGGFDERFAPAYYEETDYCVRLWKSGRRVVFDPDAAIVHYEFASSGTGDAMSLQAANHATFVAQHREWLAEQFPASPANLIAARTARSTARRVLVLEDRVPKVELGTGYPRTNRLVHELTMAGAQVAFFPMIRHKETWPEVRKALDKRIEVLIAAAGSQIRTYLEARRGHFDAIVICRPHNMETFQNEVGFEHDLIGDAVVFYDAEALFVTRTLQRLTARGASPSDLERHRMVAQEVSLTRLADHVISVSAGERDLLVDYGARNVHLLGHALEDAPIEATFDERDQIVFMGAIQEDAAPNADAVRWFAAEVLPQVRRKLGQDLRLTVVGLNEAPSIAALDGGAIDLVGMVEDLRPALARARIMVVPSRYGAGIPHKAHQAAMLGIPMVVTGLIADQLGWENGQEILVACDATDFAAACARLYVDRALWEELRGNALARARRDCAPDAFSATVRQLLAAIPLTHRQPEPAEGATRPVARTEPAPDEAASEADVETSRPAATDFSAAVPFGFAPLVTSAPPRIGVMCHLFHMEVAPEVLFYLRHLPATANLFLSTDTNQKLASLQSTFSAWDKGRVEARVMPNRGRDIAPKLVGFADAYADHDLVLHLHSKKSSHADWLAPWRSFLYENLAGSPEVVSSILDAFARLPDLGMIAPQHYEGVRRWLGWMGNFDTASTLATRMGITLSPTRALDFPSGSMFWARPAALRPLLELGLTFEDFPEEGSQVDRTPAHAIERLFFYVCERSGHTWLKVAQPDLYFDTATIVHIPTPVALSRFVSEHGVMLSGLTPLPCAAGPAPLVTDVPPGLTSRLATRSL